MATDAETVCALLTDYDAVRMYSSDLVEKALDVQITDETPAERLPTQPYEEYFSEGGLFRHVGRGSRIREKMNKRGAGAAALVKA